MTNFDKAIERVVKHEGGYVNHPKDPGGETNWGITRNTATAVGYKGSMRNMTSEQAIAIYRARCERRVMRWLLLLIPPTGCMSHSVSVTVPITVSIASVPCRGS